MFDGAKRRLVTPIEKKEPITPDMLLKLYNSVFKDLPLQNFCVFPIFESYYVSIFIPKSKTDIYRNGNTVVITRMDSNLYPVKKFRKVFIVVE